MIVTVRAAIVAAGIAAGIVAAVSAGGPLSTSGLAEATTSYAASASEIRLAGFDRVLADDDSCNSGSLQGSYYCYQQGASQSQNINSNDTQPQSNQSDYTPVQPAYGYNNLPQCSAGSSAIVGALSGEGCSS